jgi:hypothetical protein
MSKDVKPIEYNKAEWGDGPWQNEPDRVEFEHEGFPCLILRTQLGHLCGYVAVSPNHPDYNKDYNDVNVKVHGGLTYAGMCSGHICHVPKEGEPDNVYWLGFDHAHCGDYSPFSYKYGGPSRFKDWEESYKDINYVTKGVKHLAEQLKSIQELGYNKFLKVDE